MLHGSSHLPNDYSVLPDLISPEKQCFYFNQTFDDIKA